jgi:hypothetical protein
LLGSQGGCDSEYDIWFGTDPEHGYAISPSYQVLRLQIQVTVPANFGGTVDVRVHNACGTSPVHNAGITALHWRYGSRIKLKPAANPTLVASQVSGTTSQQTVGRRRRLLSAGLAAFGCAVAIAACGSSSDPTATAASNESNGSSQGLKFADCMRSHGVPNFPDPSAGGGINISSGSGINPFSPAFKAAQNACAKLLPGGGPGNQHPTAGKVALARQTSECMRQHGVTGFPDPTLKQPSSPAGYSILEDRGGVIFAVPSTINPQSPVFLQAAKACHFS